ELLARERTRGREVVHGAIGSVEQPPLLSEQDIRRRRRMQPFDPRPRLPTDQRRPERESIRERFRERLGPPAHGRAVAWDAWPRRRRPVLLRRDVVADPGHRACERYE